MNIEEFRTYCISKKGVTEEFPFDQETLVFKVMGKMFTATSISNFDMFNLKCDPEKAVELREQYEYVRPGWHMNKKHWNSIDVSWENDDKLLKEWIDHSYELVASGLTKKLKEELQTL